MHFDEGNGDAAQRIAQRDAGVGERAGVQDHERGAGLGRPLHDVDQFVLGIALPRHELMPQFAL